MNNKCRLPLEHIKFCKIPALTRGLENERGSILNKYGISSLVKLAQLLISNAYKKTEKSF